MKSITKSVEFSSLEELSDEELVTISGGANVYSETQGVGYSNTSLTNGTVSSDTQGVAGGLTVSQGKDGTSVSGNGVTKLRVTL